MTKTLASLALALIASLATMTPADAAPRRLPVCQYEDGSGQAICVWDAKHMGNGNGQSFIARNPRNGAESFKVISHRKAHRLLFGR